MSGLKLIKRWKLLRRSNKSGPSFESLRSKLAREPMLRTVPQQAATSRCRVRARNHTCRLDCLVTDWAGGFSCGFQMQLSPLRASGQHPSRRASQPAFLKKLRKQTPLVLRRCEEIKRPLHAASKPIAGFDAEKAIDQVVKTL